MDEVSKGCGTFLVFLGSFAILIGLLEILAGQQLGGWIVFGAGFSTIISGIFFKSLGEIIARLPKPLNTETGKACSRCAEQVKREASYCRYCGFEFAVDVQDLKEQSREEPTSRLVPCPNCRREIPRNLTRCTFCRQEIGLG